MRKKTLKQILPYGFLLIVFLFPLYKVIENNFDLRHQYDLMVQENQKNMEKSHAFISNRFAELSITQALDRVEDQLETLEGKISTMNYLVEDGVRYRNDYTDFILITENHDKTYMEYALKGNDRIYLPLTSILRVVENLEDDSLKRDYSTRLDDYTQTMVHDRESFDKRSTYINVYGDLFIETISLAKEGVHLTMDNGKLTINSHNHVASHDDYLTQFSNYMNAMPPSAHSVDQTVSNEYLQSLNIMVQVIINNDKKVAIKLSNSGYELIFRKGDHTAIVHDQISGESHYVLNIPGESMRYYLNANDADPKLLHRQVTFTNDTIPFDMLKLFQIVEQLFDDTL